VSGARKASAFTAEKDGGGRKSETSGDCVQYVGRVFGNAGTNGGARKKRNLVMNCQEKWKARPGDRVPDSREPVADGARVGTFATTGPTRQSRPSQVSRVFKGGEGRRFVWGQNHSMAARI
jgi:hypothetical protein